MSSKIFSEYLNPALISAGVSLLFSIIYFFGNNIRSRYLKCKQLKIYKEYIIEFLENYLYSLENKKFKYYEKEYEISKLQMAYYFNAVELVNALEVVTIESVSLYPLVILSFFKENKILSNEETSILLDIILQISEHNKIFILDYAIKRDYHDFSKKIIRGFSRFEILSLNNKRLAGGLPNEHIATIDHEETDLTNEVRTILESLKKSESKKYDKRIGRIIDKHTLNKIY